MADTASPPSGLKAALGRDAAFPGGSLRVPYPADVIDLRAGVLRHLVEGGFTSEPLPVETLHLRVSAEHQRTDSKSLNTVSTRLSAAPAGLMEAYRGVVRHLAREVLKQDVLFEANPFLRFYFPGFTLDGYRSPGGTAVSYHSDTLFGDSFEQINCWLPLGRCKGTNTLQCGSFDRSIELLTRFAEEIEFDLGRFATGRDVFFAYLNAHPAFLADVVATCSPVNMDYGEVLLFDPRVLHGTLDNEEDETRVSIDFRLLPVSAYWAQRLQGSPSLRGVARRLRGYYWDARRAFEL